LRAALRHNPGVRWHYRDAPLVWLFPICFSLHLIEEWFGGFPEWAARVVGSELPRGAFIGINALALLVMLMAVRATVATERNGWMGIAVATILLVNGTAHILGSLVTRSYSPGLLTGIVLYLPLGQLTLMRAWLQSSRATFAGGVVAGLAVHALVVVVAYAFVALAR
jgi:hypothetical protein